ncbi:unnamed protein product [Closterium sp. NIES-64]|nr:unnamed protein product [Closterium sp. NIES-64]
MSQYCFPFISLLPLFSSFTPTLCCLSSLPSRPPSAASLLFLHAHPLLPLFSSFTPTLTSPCLTLFPPTSPCLTLFPPTSPCLTLFPPSLPPPLFPAFRLTPYPLPPPLPTLSPR